MYTFALGLLFLTIAAILALALIIGYHFVAYRVPRDKSFAFLAVFVAGTMLFVSGLLVSFVKVPWNDLADIVQSYR